jgi:DNA-binding HxlR family transcriptional regulator
MIPENLDVRPRCPIRTTMELIGGKWKLLIIFGLAPQALRLSQLKKRIPDISEKMLIQELKLLVESELVERIDHQEAPPRVTYQLTDKGRKVLPLIEEMRHFATEYEKK